MKRWRIAVFAAVLLFALPASAQSADDEWGEGGDDSGFADFGDEATPTKAEEVAEPPPTSPLTITGIYRSDLGAWVERFGEAPSDAPQLPGGNDNPFAKARASLDLRAKYKKGAISGVLELHGEYDFAYLHREDEYDPATKRMFQSLRDPLLNNAPVQIREAYLAASLDDFEVTLGRQIVAWGEGDGLSPLDVVNPRDNREPGLADLDDIRVPILAARLGWFKGNSRVEGMVTVESHWGFRNPPLGPFSPFPTLIEQNPIAKQADVVNKMRRDDVDFSDDPDQFSPDGFQYLLRWVHKGEGLDLGLYAGSVVDRQGVIKGFSQQELVALIGNALNDEVDDIRIHMSHLRYAIFGTSGATTFGSFLVKWELAFEKSRPYNMGSFDQVTNERVDQVDTMIGITYSGISNTMIGIEASKATLLGNHGELMFPIDAPFLALRLQHTAMRERLKIMAVASAVGETAQYGWLARANATYDVADAMKVSIGYVTYHPTDEISPFSGLTRHDRVFLQYRWDFRVM